PDRPAILAAPDHVVAPRGTPALERGREKAAGLMANEAWNRRRTAAKKYQPNRVRLLLVAEAPPAEESLYFYFEDHGSREALFDEVCAVLFEETAAGNKE